MRPVYVFDRFGQMVDTVAWPLEFTHDDELSGDDSIDLVVRGNPLSYGQRLVWQDRHGEWREHIVSDLDDYHDGNEITQTIHAENSISELLGEYLVEVEPGDVTASAAVTRCLQGTNWSPGTIDISGSETFSWYHESVHEALQDIIETFAAEYQTRVTVSATKVTGRYLDLRQHLGSDKGRLYAFGRNLSSVTRTVSPEGVYTAMYGYGKSLPTEGGGQSRKLTFGSVNGGLDYVADEAAKELYGIPDGHGGKKHAFGQVEFSNVEDANQLKSLTLRQLAISSQPTVTYTMDSVSLAAGGVKDPEDVRKGDTIHVRDPKLGLRITTRVLKVTYDELNPSNDKITFGTKTPTITAKVKAAEKLADQAQITAEGAQNGVNDLNNRSKEWDDTSDIVDTAPGEWLQKVMDRLNEEFDAAKTYKFSSFDKGDIWANGPLTADGKPTGDTSAAINLNGLGLRISSRVENGDFVWTTFGTGEGFTASVINVGTLRCGSNYLNLDTGEMRLALSTTTVDGGTSLNNYVNNTANSAASTAANSAKSSAVSEAKKYTDKTIADADFIPSGEFESHLTMRNVASALTNGFVDKGLFISSGHVVFNGDYVRTGVIEAQSGNSFFDLNNGYLEASGTITSVGQRHTMRSRLINGQLGLRMDNTDIGILGTYTRSNNANYHATGLKAFTNLVLASPSLSVSTDGTSSSSMSWQECINGDINHVAGVTSSGSTVTFDLWTSTFTHGLMVSQTNKPDASWTAPKSASLADERIKILASAEPASEVIAGEPIEVSLLTTDEELDAAVDEGRMVWAQDSETGGLGIPIYTGEDWTCERPTPSPAKSIEIPLASAVDAQTSLLQAEIEAVADAVGGTEAAALKSRLATARIALQGGSPVAIATAAKEVSNGGGTARV